MSNKILPSATLLFATVLYSAYGVTGGSVKGPNAQSQPSAQATSPEETKRIKTSAATSTDVSDVTSGNKDSGVRKKVVSRKGEGRAIVKQKEGQTMGDPGPTARGDDTLPIYTEEVNPDSGVRKQK